MHPVACKAIPHTCHVVACSALMPSCCCSSLGMANKTTATLANKNQLMPMPMSNSVLCERQASAKGKPWYSSRRCLMAMNIGVSCKCFRIHTASKPNTPPNTNGKRHAPAFTTSVLNAACKVKTDKEPNKIPTDSPAVSKPLANPTWLTGTCSDTYVHAAGTSPPMATACTMRQSNNSNGAANPI